MHSGDKKPLDAAGFAGGIAGADAASTEAAASDALSARLNDFLDAAKRHALNETGRTGFLFEHLEVAKFNADAARKGLGVEARVTSGMPGRGTDPVDIEIVSAAGEVIKKVQLKASSDARWLEQQASDPKYEGMGLQVPSDMEDRVTSPQGREVSGELAAEGASSGGTTNTELNAANNTPRLHAASLQGSQLLREMAVSSGHAALLGGVMGGVVSLVRNAHSHAQGQREAPEILPSVAADAKGLAARSAAVSGLATFIRHTAGATRAGSALSTGNVATAVAAGLLDVERTVRAYAKGDISAETVAEQLGRTGVETVSGLYVGAAAAVLFPPVGAALGSFAGYFVAATVYQSCIKVLKDARSSEKESDRVAALCFEAVEVMEAQRTDFEKRTEIWLGQRQRVFDDSFVSIDQALVHDQASGAIQALSSLVATCGQELKLAKFEEFDRMMTETDGPIAL